MGTNMGHQNPPKIHPWQLLDPTVIPRPQKNSKIRKISAARGAGGRGEALRSAAPHRGCRGAFRTGIRRLRSQDSDQASF